MHFLRKFLKYSRSATVRFALLPWVFVKLANSIKILLFSSWELADAEYGRNWIPWHSLCETLTWVTSTASFSVEFIISINPVEVDLWLFSTNTLALPSETSPLVQVPGKVPWSILYALMSQLVNLELSVCDQGIAFLFVCWKHFD